MAIEGEGEMMLRCTRRGFVGVVVVVGRDGKGRAPVGVGNPGRRWRRKGLASLSSDFREAGRRRVLSLERW